jgi:hypothetical protein
MTIDLISLQGRLKNLETAVFGGANVASEPLPDATLSIIERMVQLKQLQLTNAQIKALPTTPIKLIDAPGDGLQIVPWLGFAHFDSHGAYTNFDMSQLLAIAYQNSSNSILSIGAPDLMLGSAADYDLQFAAASGPGDLSTVTDNGAVYLKYSNGSSGNLTGGNAANSLLIQVFYGIIDLSL